MSDMISGVVGQFFQQSLENQTLKQTPTETQGKRSFESYLQKDKTTQTDETEKTQTTSGSDLQKSLDEMQTELAGKYKQTEQQTNKINQLIPDLTDSQTRLGLLKDAYRNIGGTSKVTNDLTGRMTQVESEYKAVEAIMRSDKNLSPGELLALQARLYQVGQHIEVMSKVVDQMAGGIKTVLNTNI